MTSTKTTVKEPQEGAPLLAGYAVVRRSGRRATVAAPSGELSALLLGPQEAEEVLRRALGRLPAHEHRERLVDVAVDQRGTVVLTEPAVVTTLDRVLDSGRSLRPGHVVTVVAPLVAALRDAIAAGVLLAPTAESIGLTADGRPVLLVGSAAEASTTIEVQEAVRAVLARCRERCPDWPGSLVDSADLDEIEAELYRSAAPLPLGDLLTASPPVRADPALTATERRRSVGATSVARLLPRGRHQSRVPAGGESAVAGRHRRPHPFDDWRRRARGLCRERRGPLTAAAAILVGAAVATTTAGQMPEARGVPWPTATTSNSARPTAGTAPVVPPDLDPAEAARRLVVAVTECGGSDAGCLRDLTTADSPLRRSGADPVGELLPADPSISAVAAEVNGASALVSIDAGGTTAASVLIIRTEAGWLIRDVFSGGGA